MIDYSKICNELTLEQYFSKEVVDRLLDDEYMDSILNSEALDRIGPSGQILFMSK